MGSFGVVLEVTNLLSTNLLPDLIGGFDASTRHALLYSSDPEKVKAILLKAADGHPDVLKKPAADVMFTDYGDNSINFALRVWTEKKTHSPAVLKSDLYFTLFKMFGEARIELPFPQRDLHLRSSDVALGFWGADGAGVREFRLTGRR